ncbi:bifunctional kinase-pyrophosphorylase [Nitzschia inconspicua]|uniref:Bifunctional kinase-pyrophosphorylase n=1 Tax=Nitzschia inconspicua TaxID=303405 RepID=A0A9K3LG22_9STRA|nr:bifunctional kinase-pyrophosphorylase [Nitzschia inconspicua]
MDMVAFAMLTTVATAIKRKRVDAVANSSSSLFFVTKDNEPLLEAGPCKATLDTNSQLWWHRATYVLIMHDPPEMFYEPKEWSHTIVLLWKDINGKMLLPGQALQSGESYTKCAARRLYQLGIDVSQPENCLHPLFTFADDKTRQWSDFMECVYRGTLDHLVDDSDKIVRLSLEELNDKVVEEESAFDATSHFALRLYFQRQMDLRARRRLLKGYSSSDLQRYYGMRQQRSDNFQSIIFRADERDSERQDALDYTMKTDDGMSPRLLQSADAVLIGVSRAGKTPLSLLLSQTKGIKVANVPLVLELPPPQLLFEKVDPKRVFCITQQAEHLVQVRRNRLRRELKQTNGPRSTYADLDYVRRDVDHAKEVSREHGFTIIDITDRAMEEAASLIMSKLKERFPNSEFGDQSM